MKQFAFILFLSTVLLTACTTATYGAKPSVSIPQQDIFTLKVFTGGFAAGNSADKRAVKEFDKYKEEKGYSSYTILEKEYEVVPSGFLYTVKFFR